MEKHQHLSLEPMSRTSQKSKEKKIISKIVVCITSVLENATPIANDRRVNNFIRIIVNKIWQMLAAIKKNNTVDEKFLSIANS